MIIGSFEFSLCVAPRNRMVIQNMVSENTNNSQNHSSVNKNDFASNSTGMYGNHLEYEYLVIRKGS